jgi:hypothetical protein
MNVQARAIGPAKNEYSFREGESTIVLSKKESTIVSVILVAHVFFSTDLYFVSASVPIGKIPYPECFKVARLSAGLPSLID